MQKENNIVQLKDITVAFDGETVLDNLSLDIKDKEFITFLGVDWGAHFPVFENYGNIRLELLDAVHDRDFYDPIGDDGHIFAYCDAALCEDDGSQQFINGCYEKARQARFEHGECG